jgi:hypothetical protein
MAHPISNRVRDALVAAALFGGVGITWAQAPAPNAQAPNAQAPNAQAPNAQAPNANDGNVQSSESPKVPGHEGVEEPSAKQNPQPPAGVFVNGTLSVPNAPKDTDTTPAKFSATNDHLDHVPIMARGPQLTDAQRKLILDRVSATAAESQPKPEPKRPYVGPSTMLSADADMKAWPADLVGAIPAIRDTKYVALSDKVLVVRPESWTVVEEIDR